MRQLPLAIVTTALFVMTGCSEADENYASMEVSQEAASSPSIMADMAEESAMDGALAPLAQRTELPVNMPKMAYVFDYGFSLAGEEIAKIQQTHADMCENMGPYSCQIVEMSHSGELDDEVYGNLQLAVVADRARSFGASLLPGVESLGGEQVTANIAGEDLSKQMVDTSARLESRIVLRDRLLEVLKTRKGDVSELVEAERSVARVNEEIDQARSWLEEMRGRVSFSRVNLTYQSTTPVASDLFGPAKGAIASLGSIFGVMLAGIILIGSVLGPLFLAIFGIKRLARRFGWGEQAET